MFGFKNFCSLPSFHNSINGTHFSITKHANPFSEYYYYHKTWGYSLDCQVVVHDKKQFTDLFVKLPRNVNDSRIFKRSSFQNKAQYHGLFNLEKGCQDDIPLDLLGDKKYPLLDLILTHHVKGDHTILNSLFSRKHRKGRSMVNNHFDILKKTFVNFMVKYNQMLQLFLTLLFIVT